MHGRRGYERRAGDACGNRRTGRTVKRSAAVIALLAVPLAACKQPPGAQPLSPSLVQPGMGITIEDLRSVPASDAASRSSDAYYIVTFAWTNGLGYALAPSIDHFVLEDTNNRRFLGADSGTSALVGIANYAGVLAAGATHAYTVGFRVPQNTTGLLFYDATF